MSDIARQPLSQSVTQLSEMTERFLDLIEVFATSQLDPKQWELLGELEKTVYYAAVQAEDFLGSLKEN